MRRSMEMLSIVGDLGRRKLYHFDGGYEDTARCIIFGGELINGPTQDRDCRMDNHTLAHGDQFYNLKIGLCLQQ